VGQSVFKADLGASQTHLVGGCSRSGILHRQTLLQCLRSYCARLCLGRRTLDVHLVWRLLLLTHGIGINTQRRIHIDSVSIVGHGAMVSELSILVRRCCPMCVALACEWLTQLAERLLGIWVVMPGLGTGIVRTQAGVVELGRVPWLRSELVGREQVVVGSIGVDVVLPL